MVQNRLDGRQVYGRVTMKNLDSVNSSQGTSTAVRLDVQFTELNKFHDAPLGTPVFGTITNSCDVFTVPIHLRKATLNSSGPTTQPAMAFYHFTDSNNLLFGTAPSPAAGLTGVSGDSGVLVIPDSTLNYGAGRIIANSTGRATLIITSTGTSTCRPRITLMNGLVTTGNNFSFS